MEYGESFCAWAIWNRDDKTMLKLEYYTFESNAVAHVCSIIDIIRQESDKINAITTCSFYPYSVLVPVIGNSSPEDVASAVYRDRSAVSLTDLIRERKMVNNYLVPVSIHAAIKKEFPYSSFFHAYTPALRIRQDNMSADHILLHFTSKSCRVIVNKDQQPQLAQIYSYTASLDIVYILLKLFQEFNLHREETVIWLSGLIDRDSVLYTDLYAYFFRLEFAVPDIVVIEDESYPQHYFTSFANLAACVS